MVDLASSYDHAKAASTDRWMDQQNTHISGSTSYQLIAGSMIHQSTRSACVDISLLAISSKMLLQVTQKDVRTVS